MTQEQFIKEIGDCQEGMRRFLLSLCNGDAFLADDIAQDAAIKAWMALDSFRGASKFSTWLFRIAYNCWYSRRSRVSELSLESNEVMNVPDEESADCNYRYEALYAAIKGLKDNEKAAVLLFYMEDKSIKEIASIMGAPEGSVKSLLSRGRSHLRITMSNEKLF